MAIGERIDFQDTGDWWEIRKFITVGIEREYRRIAIDSQSLDEHPEKIGELSQAVDHMVLASTLSWSYGDLTIDILHSEVPAHHYGQVTERMMSLYLPLLLSNLERLVNNYQLASS